MSALTNCHETGTDQADDYHEAIHSTVQDGQQCQPRFAHGEKTQIISYMIVLGIQNIFLNKKCINLMGLSDMMWYDL